ncbi:ABC transporter ATP-binding protein NatA [Geodia barretti]|uniref:ABC transporter ATP-binding protein NatA n=1 Tax=Geodia barretti TaxID=519541 RepID=A0AA35WDN3_GEOBA|nr:ABC transporter ATP-binding protein NatA [Geodia barretti]
MYNDLTCRENLAFYGQLYGIANINLRIQQVLEQVGLSDRRNRRVRTLSHGMQKRLSVARAILHEPTVLLMDEPESGLDQASTETLGRLLRDWAAAGKSVLMTTHSDQTGLAWADRVLALSGGRLAYDAAAAQTTAADLKDALRAQRHAA